jgi:hypothetical protein
MDGLAARIAKRASGIKPVESDFSGCFWAEQVARYHRRETDKDMNQRLRKHLEECEECNTLLMALAVNSEDKFRWIERGVRRVLDSILSLGELGAAEGYPVPVMRGNQDDFSLSGKKITLPDGGSLYINVVVQAQKRILTAAAAEKRRYDLYTPDGKILKSIDNAHQIRIDMSGKDVVLVMDDRYEINIRDTA